MNKRLVLTGAALSAVIACQGNVALVTGSGGSGGTANTSVTNSGNGGSGGTGGAGAAPTTSTSTGGGLGGSSASSGAGGDDCIVVLPAELAHDPVDIVFVVDNSGSMDLEVGSLQQNLYPYFSVPANNSGIDHRFIIVGQHGTGTPNVCIPAPLSGNPNDCSGPPVSVPGQFYHYSVDVQSHDAVCKLLDTFYGNEPDQFNLAPGGWSQWLRPEALKALIALTDDGISCTWNVHNFNDGNNATNGQQAAIDFDQQLLALSPLHFGNQMDRNYVFYSLVGLAPITVNMPNDPWGPLDPVTTDECPQAVDPGTGYQWLSKGTDGLRYPLCDTSAYSSIFQGIAADLEQQTENLCRLTIPPETLDVNTITIDYIPSNNRMPIDMTLVMSAAQCGPQNFYIENNLFYICPDMCAQIEADPNPQLYTREVVCPDP